MPSVPAGLSVLLPVPFPNPLTEGRLALGRRLFFDKRLSRDGRVACASCHKPAHAFADDRPISQAPAVAWGAATRPAC